jgi:small conductance mechanosensitive channel
MWATLTEKLDVQSLVTTVAAYIPDVIAALLLIAAFWIALIICRRCLRSALEHAGVPESIRDVAVRFLKYAVVILALLTVASQLGFDVTTLIAGLGVAGLAVSLAARDTVTNIIAGITLAVDRPFQKGDWIRIGDLNARVTQVRLRRTVLTTFENETMVVPNQDIATERIINYTLTDRIRVRVSVGIAYKEDIEEAREILLSTLEGDDTILEDPAPAVVVTELAGSSVNLELRFWLEDPWPMLAKRAEYTEKCKKALDAADIEIPFPHLQMFLEKSEGLAELKAPTDG